MIESFWKKWKMDFAAIQESKLSGKSKNLVIDDYVTVTKNGVWRIKKRCVWRRPHNADEEKLTV